MSVFVSQDDEVVLQCVACIQKENRKFCLSAEGLGNRLCYLEPTSEAKVRTHSHTHIFILKVCYFVYFPPVFGLLPFGWLVIIHTWSYMCSPGIAGCWFILVFQHTEAEYMDFCLCWRIYRRETGQLTLDSRHRRMWCDGHWVRQGWCIVSLTAGLSSLCVCIVSALRERNNDVAFIPRELLYADTWALIPLCF